MTMITRALPLALAALSASVALAAEPKMSPEAFVNAAGQSDTYEIAAGRLVVAQGQAGQVKAFAQQMIEHHGQTSAALSEAARASNLPPPPKTLSGDQQRMLSALQSLKSPELEKAYMTQQVNAHASALVTQQGYAAAGDDPNLRRAAQAAVPIIQRHLESARSIKDALPKD